MVPPLAAAAAAQGASLAWLGLLLILSAGAGSAGTARSSTHFSVPGALHKPNTRVARAINQLAGWGRFIRINNPTWQGRVSNQHYSQQAQTAAMLQGLECRAAGKHVSGWAVGSFAGFIWRAETLHAVVGGTVHYWTDCAHRGKLRAAGLVWWQSRTHRGVWEAVCRRITMLVPLGTAHRGDAQRGWTQAAHVQQLHGGTTVHYG
jgi:hypothetical protein